MLNIRSYKKFIKNSKVGDTFYLNAVNASIGVIEYTKELIKTGKIAPDSDELNKMIIPEAQHMFYNGASIAPQMTYKIIA